MSPAMYAKNKRIPAPDGPVKFGEWRPDVAKPEPLTTGQLIAQLRALHLTPDGKPAPDRDLVGLYAQVVETLNAIEGYFDRRAAEVKLGCPGLPVQMIKRDLTLRFTCPCRAAMGMIEEQVADKARIAGIENNGD